MQYYKLNKCNTNNLHLPQLNVSSQVNNSLEVYQDSPEQNIIKREMAANETQEVGLNPEFINMDVEMQTPDGIDHNNSFLTHLV